MHTRLSQLDAWLLRGRPAEWTILPFLCIHVSFLRKVKISFHIFERSNTPKKVFLLCKTYGLKQWLRDLLCSAIYCVPPLPQVPQKSHQCSAVVGIRIRWFSLLLGNLTKICQPGCQGHSIISPIDRILIFSFWSMIARDMSTLE